MAGHKTIWSVGGGKGGVGKSIATANIGCGLARRGKEVVLVDADLGGANLHTYFGIKYPEKSLEDFLKGRAATLEEVMIPTGVEGMRLISGGGEFLGIANPAYAQKQKLIAHIKKLEADYILVDLGAGSSYNVLDFFALSNSGIVVLVPEPAAIQNAYIFLKSFVYRRLQRTFADNLRVSEMIKDATDLRSPGSVKTFSDLCERISREDRTSAERALSEIKSFRPKLLLNMATSREDMKAAEAFKAAAAAFLGLDTDFIGVMYSRAAVKAASRKMRPFMLDEDAEESRAEMLSVIDSLVGKEPSGAAPAHEESHEVFGFNDNVSHLGTVFHVQTEVQAGASPTIETVIYNGGRIFFSKKSLWNEIRKTDGDGSLREFAGRQHRAAMAAIRLNKITVQG
ncbi:MAG: P-loop NTPase [Deltaproteobacteria bacterium]|nr:P-loop NTPase [Deltaproteobacteria bacterium]